MTLCFPLVFLLLHKKFHYYDKFHYCDKYYRYKIRNRKINSINTLVYFLELYRVCGV